ncbi:MAG: hypothetical protein ACRDTG_06845 [Pseudonocardiaceae bacterium]
MFSTISALAHRIWTWLPEATATLQFGAALIGFCLAMDVAIQRHRNRRYQVGPADTRVQDPGRPEPDPRS